MKFPTKKKVFRSLKNKYVVAILILVVQLAFFESVDLWTLYKQKRRERALHAEIKDLQHRSDKIRAKYESLTVPELREKYAREVYNFKRDNEVIFVLSNE